MKTSGSPRLTLLQGGDGATENGNALSIFGPVRAGLITMPTTLPPQRMVLLRGWGRRARIHESRSSKGFAISNTDTTRRVRRGLSGSNDTTTDKIGGRW